ncbi:uncharacterized protein LOC117292733 [Asterias rubens]|uniref:uncharacterized protein LOC117292733 n=1 Tax=Asterias rubens TaxID=7604 RepID=UPI0014555375|nr:uncharacterized protein LOC117292733 [Asterias rubens]
MPVMTSLYRAQVRAPRSSDSERILSFPELVLSSCCQKLIMSSDEQKPPKKDVVDVLFMLGAYSRKAKVPKGASRTSLDEIAKQVLPGTNIFKYYDEDWKEWVEVQEGRDTISTKSKIRIECVPNESATEINKGSTKAKAEESKTSVVEPTEDKPVTDVGIGPALGEKPNQEGLNKEDASKKAKYEILLNERIGKKKVTELPGIGPVSGEKLKQKGFLFMKHLVGIYLTMHGNEKEKEDFIDWFCEKIEAKRREDAIKCYTLLKEWTKKHINIDSN